MNQITPWHIVYHKIALQLHQLYKKHKNQSGKVLFNIVNNSSKYRRYNSWLSNITRIKIPTIEPIQLFVSFSRSRQNEIVRIEIINEVCSLLGINTRWEQINFEGCPTPVAIKLQYIRPEHIQIKIWEAFDEVMKKGKKALTPSLWLDVKEWRGVQIPAFTIFLFWINNDNFIPLDKNTRQYLEQGGLLKRNSGSAYEEYSGLLNNRNIKNYKELSLEAYYFVNEPKVFIKKFNNGSIIQSADINNATFKFVGIRTLNRNSKVHKVLSPNQYYPFDSTLILNDDIGSNSNQIERFKLKSSEIESLYNLENLKINITAVVGKNGSGKSTLLDLFLMGIYNLSVELGYLDKDKNNPIQRLNIEIFWHTDNLYKLVLGKEIRFYGFKKINNENSNIIYELIDEPLNIKDLKENYFYSILINYSHYALNSADYNIDWITPLSHKNDGYITPLVINPKRTEGNIDINSQKHLLNMRLLVNLIELHDADIPLQSFRYIDNGKYLKYFSISYDDKKQKEKEKEVIEHIYENQKFIKIIKKQVKKVLGLLESSKIISPYCNAIELYIVNKIFTIVSRYDQYKNKYDEGLQKLYNNYIASMVDGMEAEIEMEIAYRIENLLEDIKQDKSHITLKVKQAVNYLKYPKLRKTVNEALESKNLIEFDVYKRVIENIINDNPAENLMIAEFLPPPIFKLDFHLDDANKSSFNKASSGEYQLLSVLSSIVYHIRNIDSIEGNSRYNYVAVLLDEIELYFHPNLQRLFVKKLLDALSKLETELYGIHILFATHSPFILSDLQQPKILKLNKGKVEKNVDSYNTFAANIHDLLADEFFLEEGYIGAFAQRKIEEAINILNYIIANNELKNVSLNSRALNKEERNVLTNRWASEKLLYRDKLSTLGYWTEKRSPENWDAESVKTSIFELIELIGEPIIKEKLKNMFTVAFTMDNRKGTDNRNKAKQAIIKLMMENNINYNELM